MNLVASGFPILTLLTVLPLFGAAIALFAGKHARGVALITSLCCLGLSLLIWTSLPANASTLRCSCRSVNVSGINSNTTG